MGSSPDGAALGAIRKVVNLLRNLVETVRRYGRIYQAGTQQRSEYGGKFRIACELVRNGHIGQLKEVYAWRQPGAFYPFGVPLGEPKPVPDGFDWDLWLGPLPRQPYCGSAGHALPGCFIGDVNWTPHHYDFVQWVLDADRTGPVAVEWEGTAPHEGARAPPGEGAVHYHYANGVVVHSTPYPGEGIAIALQRAVRWDPVKEEFPGDEQANRLLSYSARAPWGA